MISMNYMTKFDKYLIITSVIAIVYFIVKFYKYDVSLSRSISRKVGWLMKRTLPKFSRRIVFNLYCYFYKVNKEEIKEQNFQSYRSVNDFFVRKIKV